MQLLYFYPSPLTPLPQGARGITGSFFSAEPQARGFKLMHQNIFSAALNPICYEPARAVDTIYFLQYTVFMIDFAAAENIKELAALASEIWHEYWPGLLSLEQIDYMVNKFQSETAVKEQIKNENYTYFFIVYNGIKAGYTGLSLKDDYLFLSKIYIKKDFRHKGLGSQAFDFIKKYAEKADYNKIILTVNKQNTNTINAYKKWGFKIIDSAVTDIGSGFVMDDYIMQYDI